ncbi:MAG: hypothetical protein K6L80_12205 [Agarilytica sp.]
MVRLLWKKGFTLFLIFSCQIGIADNKIITITDSAQYIDKEVVATNIANECTSLGAQFSDSTANYLTKYGWKVKRESTLPKKDITLKLSIKNAISAGNAWSGHRKSVSIKAEVYKNGELIDTYTGTRNSGGGFGAGFKGSCKVLHRCVKTLGKDVSKWLNSTNI